MKDYILSSGLKIGALYIFLTVFAYVMGVDFHLNVSWSIIKPIIPYCLLFFFVLRYKKLVGGYLSFKETFTVTIGSIVAGAFISTFFTILLFNFIDPDFAVLLKDSTIEKMVVQLEELPESNAMYGYMENLIEQTEKEDIYSISNLASAFFYSIFFHIIFSLIIAAFVKKDKPIEISE